MEIGRRTTADCFHLNRIRGYSLVILRSSVMRVFAWISRRDNEAILLYFSAIVARSVILIHMMSNNELAISSGRARESLLQFNRGTVVIPDGFIAWRRIYAGGKTWFTSAGVRARARAGARTIAWRYCAFYRYGATSNFQRADTKSLSFTAMRFLCSFRERFSLFSPFFARGDFPRRFRGSDQFKSRAQRTPDVGSFRVSPIVKERCEITVIRLHLINSFYFKEIFMCRLLSGYFAISLSFAVFCPLKRLTFFSLGYNYLWHFFEHQERKREF